MSDKPGADQDSDTWSKVCTRANKLAIKREPDLKLIFDYDMAARQ